MASESRRSQMLRGVLDLCLLAVVVDEPAYGYEMTRRLRERGLSTVGEGSIYPLLGRLERDGLVATHRAASDGGPPRKYYRASPSGRARSPRACARGATCAARWIRFWRRSKRRWRDDCVRRGVPAGVEAARRAGRPRRGDGERSSSPTSPRRRPTASRRRRSSARATRAASPRTGPANADSSPSRRHEETTARLAVDRRRGLFLVLSLSWLALQTVGSGTRPAGRCESRPSDGRVPNVVGMKACRAVHALARSGVDYWRNAGHGHGTPATRSSSRRVRRGASSDAATTGRGDAAARPS